MKICYPVLFFLLLCCSCNKTQNNATPVNEDTTFSFITYYDSVITCKPNTTYDLIFNIHVLNGNIAFNRVNYSLTQLPANFSVTPSFLSVGELLGGVFFFNIGNTPFGSDTARFTISTAQGGSQSHMLIFNITPYPDLSNKLVGSYHASFDFCQPDSIYNYSSGVSQVPGMPYALHISNIKNLGTGFIVNAFVSETKPATVVIPVQTVSGYKIWGSGEFNHDAPPYDTAYQLTINDTLVHGIDTERCIIHLQHGP